MSMRPAEYFEIVEYKFNNNLTDDQRKNIEWLHNYAMELEQKIAIANEALREIATISIIPFTGSIHRDMQSVAKQALEKTK